MNTPLKKEYDTIAPDPKQWTAMVNNLIKLTQTPYDFTPDIKSIKAGTMIILGDADGIQTEHAAEMYKLLGGGRNGDMQGIPKNRLAILPGCSHTGVIMKTEWLLPMITAFLDDKK